MSLFDLGSQCGETLRRLKAQGGVPGAVIVVANPEDGDRAADAVALGADDFLPKPFTSDDARERRSRARWRGPRRSWERVPDDEARLRLHEEVGLWRSPKMSEVRDIIEQAARVDVTVLVCGETGTGKDVVARAIHDESVRQSGPYVKVNCAAVPRELLESELFGHERGAFTGAHQLKIGKFEAADRGTIFLDEIGDLHPALQGKLLHVLQDGQFSRVGGRSTVKVDVRVLAATNQDLEQAVAAGRFREDLYYRLNVIQIMVPPLRERPEEIPVLAEYFMQRYSQLFRRESLRLPPETVQRLLHHRFPGNVRELENMIKRMIVLGDPLLRRSPLTGGGRADRGQRRRASAEAGDALAQGHLAQGRAGRRSARRSSRRSSRPSGTASARPSCSRSRTGRCSTRSRTAGSTASGGARTGHERRYAARAGRRGVGAPRGSGLDRLRDGLDAGASGSAILVFAPAADRRGQP